MTDHGSEIDLDDYNTVLAQLRDEIAGYGSERRSLNEIANALAQLHQSYERVFSRVENALASNSLILAELRELELADLQRNVGERYELHQQALATMADSLQQAVREQQRAGLEMLQNTQHSKSELHRYAASVGAASSAHATAQERVERHLDQLTAELTSIKTSLTKTQQQLQFVRFLIILVLLLVVLSGAVVLIR